MSKRCKVVVRDGRIFQFLKGNHIIRVRLSQRDKSNYKYTVRCFTDVQYITGNDRFYRCVIKGVPSLIAALFEK